MLPAQIVYNLDNMEKSELLHELGLSDKEARTYLAILELGTSSIGAIADRAKVKRTSIYNFIQHLVELGLISRSMLRGRNYYTALPPTRLLSLQQERAQRLESMLPEFLSSFNAAQNKPRISYLEGPEQMRNIVREEPRCKSEALYIWTGRDIMEMIGGVRFMTEIDKARIAKGVRIRVVRFRDKDVRFPTSAHGEKYLREIRFAPPNFKISMSMGIYDTGKVGFFSSKAEGFGILIESKELEVLMRALFQSFWSGLTTAREGEG